MTVTSWITQARFLMKWPCSTPMMNMTGSINNVCLTRPYKRMSVISSHLPDRSKKETKIKKMNEDASLLMLSALQHYAYCPRQFALIHIEQAWEENRFTAEGRVLHERVDSGVAEQRHGVRSERGVLLRSETYRLTGKMDLLEIEQGNPPKYFPVEYKRGKPKVEDWDRIQLCAQALCIEEMRHAPVAEGGIGN